MESSSAPPAMPVAVEPAVVVASTAPVPARVTLTFEELAQAPPAVLQSAAAAAAASPAEAVTEARFTIVSLPLPPSMPVAAAGLNAARAGLRRRAGVAHRFAGRGHAHREPGRRGVARGGDRGLVPDLVLAVAHADADGFRRRCVRGIPHRKAMEIHGDARPRGLRRRDHAHRALVLDDVGAVAVVAIAVAGPVGHAAAARSVADLVD